MSRPKTAGQECGCKYVTEPTGREVWTELCVPHGAETRALHEQARSDHQREAHLRALEEEFT